jgi:hypothetical protein
MRISLFILVALLAVPVATAAGPWLGTASNGVGYSAVPAGGTTVVSDGTHSVTLDGKWGIPRVTMNNGVGGLSADNRVLVLGRDDVAHPNGALSRKSSFAVLGTRPLRVRTIVDVRGDFGFDALSPNGDTLFLIEHVSQENLFRYRVRAYDLDTRKLVSRVIADKRQRDWLMEGYPVARAGTENGRWVYTLYSSGNNYPFVHALDTIHRTAVCIGIPWNWAGDQQAINNATLRVQGGKLAIGSVFLLDRTTFKVRKT